MSKTDGRASILSPGWMEVETDYRIIHLLPFHRHSEGGAYVSCQGERLGTPCTAHRDRQPYTLTANLDSPVKLTYMSVCCGRKPQYHTGTGGTCRAPEGEWIQTHDWTHTVRQKFCHPHHVDHQHCFLFKKHTGILSSAIKGNLLCFSLFFLK